MLQLSGFIRSVVARDFSFLSWAERLSVGNGSNVSLGSVAGEKDGHKAGVVGKPWSQALM